MTKKIIILAVSLLSLVSCKIEIIKNKYEGVNPYIEVEKTSLNKYKDINVEDYILKFENKESFICFFYSSNCSYCHKLIENIINPYIEDTNNLVYGLDVYERNNYSLIDKIERFQPSSNDYFYAKNSNISISRPVLQVIDNGVVIDYEKGYSLNCLKLLKAYVK